MRSEIGTMGLLNMLALTAVVSMVPAANPFHRLYGGPGHDRGVHVCHLDDGGFAVVGVTEGEGPGDEDVYLLRTDSRGEPLWSRTYGGAKGDRSFSVAATADGAFLVTGYTTSLAEEGDDPYLIKIDAHGEVRWTRTIPTPDVCHTLTGEQAADHGFYLTGFAMDPATGTNSAILLKTGPEGRLMQRRDIEVTTVGRSLGYTVRATVDGGYVFTGHATAAGRADFDLLLVRAAGETIAEEDGP